MIRPLGEGEAATSDKKARDTGRRRLPFMAPFLLGRPAGALWVLQASFGLAGPLPASSASIALAIFAMSSAESWSEAASIQPSTCCGLRAPTMAPVTPGHASVHATAAAATVVRCRSEI